MATIIPSFFGFIAATMDAVILIKAVCHGVINAFAQAPDSHNFDTTTQGGAIHIWSDRRSLGNHSFDIYREICRPGDQPVSAAQLAWELSMRPQLSPLTGPLVGLANAKNDGLFKKTVTFTVANQEVTVINYYKVSDVLAGRLPRPRHFAPNLTLQLAMILSDYWAPYLTASGYAVNIKIADDGGLFPAAVVAGWSRAEGRAP
ncbi:hypothetical protein VTJ04DRAFT_517 [Mycothermus thermophilus]|uniref:uncharacterized protein n=1 Tax=Humicola insolens TaxID=85995 RepID=UPI0037425C12